MSSDPIPKEVKKVSNKKLSDGEYYGKAVTWTVVGLAALVGFVLLFHNLTGTIR